MINYNVCIYCNLGAKVQQNLRICKFCVEKVLRVSKVLMEICGVMVALSYDKGSRITN